MRRRCARTLSIPGAPHGDGTSRVRSGTGGSTGPRTCSPPCTEPASRSTSSSNLTLPVRACCRPRSSSGAGSWAPDRSRSGRDERSIRLGFGACRDAIPMPSPPFVSSSLSSRSACSMSPASAFRRRRGASSCRSYPTAGVRVRLASYMATSARRSSSLAPMSWAAIA